MLMLRRFRRTSIWELAVGDIIRFRALHQSRTGFIVPLKGKGRIEILDRYPAPEHGELPYVQGVVRDRHGIRQHFRLTDSQQVYRKAGARRSAPVSLKPAPDGRPSAQKPGRRLAKRTSP